MFLFSLVTDSLQPFHVWVANVSRKSQFSLMECSINKNSNSHTVCFPTCQETKMPVVFKNGMPHSRCKEQVSGLSRKEAALKTLA